MKVGVRQESCLPPFAGGVQDARSLPPELGGTVQERIVQPIIRALFLDVDGTLVSFRTHEAVPSAVAALREAHGRGVGIFIATGRAAGDLRVVRDIPCDGVVALNGAYGVLSDGRTLFSHPIPRDAFERALRCSQEQGFPLALELDEGIFVNRVTPDVERVARLVDHPVPRQTDLRALFDRVTCCQMCFYCDQERERGVMAEFPGLTANRWHPLFADINVRGVDKASGVAAFAAHYGFGLHEVMAFGDGGNDVPMLRAAGVGVAMGNACRAALEAADYVTDDIDDDGLYKALARLGVVGRNNLNER